MPLLLLCGQPCSGKTTVAKRLGEYLRELGVEVLIVSEESVGLERNAAYRDASSEKKTRGLLKAAVDRGVRGERVVMLDSLNSIKGYRYELWCIAKAAGTRCCVVHCELPEELSRAWNQQRRSPAYSSAVFEDLVSRFEPPDSRNRWDTPLFRINPQAESLTMDLQQIIATIWGQRNATHHTSPAGALRPNLATETAEISSTNLLNELDRTAQEVVGAIIDVQSRVGGEAAGVVEFTGVAQKLQLRRTVNTSELRRHKRAFLKLATQNTWTQLRNVSEAKRIFVEYLGEHIDQ